HGPGQLGGEHGGGAGHLWRMASLAKGVNAGVGNVRRRPMNPVARRLERRRRSRENTTPDDRANVDLEALLIEQVRGGEVHAEVVIYSVCRDLVDRPDLCN